MVDIYPPGVRIIGDGVLEIDNWTDLYTRTSVLLAGAGVGGGACADAGAANMSTTITAADRRLMPTDHDALLQVVVIPLEHKVSDRKLFKMSLKPLAAFTTIP